MRYVIVHGHFYQPPRENPWTERVDAEPSARPFHDWNARVLRECYAPNRAARVLDHRQRIAAIVDNYERLSFNFGPTLLDWMSRHGETTLTALVDADRNSRLRLGHGNAIAQAYNHAILPLLDRRDKRAQVLWGLAQFRHVFGRPAEGMWLPETAADPESLDVLAEAGVRFTVLAPWQLTAVRPTGDAPWRRDVGAGDLGRGYRHRTVGGHDMALFFYDGGVAREVAFERLLEDGERFAARLVEAALTRKADAPLLNIATDGETYGHHHRFGEMALAYALNRVQEHPDITLTNYAAFLDTYHPLWEAEVLERGSWSCSHGVERWRADCGCSTGAQPGWNQKWRAPLYEAFQTLRRGLARVFEERGAGLFRDPWVARDAYIDVLLDPSPERRAVFLDAHCPAASDTSEVWRLLEMERHALLMFTSCGWFFADLAGIETLQVLRYAARARELGGADVPAALDEEFLGILAGARTNSEPIRTGADLFREVVATSRVGAPQVAAEAVLGRRLGLGRGEVPAPPAFAAVVLPSDVRDEGTVELTHRRTMVRSGFHYNVILEATPRLSVRLERTIAPPAWMRAYGPDGGDRIEIPVEHLGSEAAQLLSDRFLQRLERKTVLRLRTLLDTRDPVVRFLEARRIRPPRALARVLEIVWQEDLLAEMLSPPGTGNGAAAWADRLARFKALGLARGDRRFADVLSLRLLRETRAFCREPSESGALELLGMLRVAAMLDPSPDLWEAQNVWYACAVRRGLRPGAAPDAVSAPLLGEVADRLGFTTAPIMAPEGAVPARPPS